MLLEILASNVKAKFNLSRLINHSFGRLLQYAAEILFFKGSYLHSR